MDTLRQGCCLLGSPAVQWLCRLLASVDLESTSSLWNSQNDSDQLNRKAPSSEGAFYCNFCYPKAELNKNKYGSKTLLISLLLRLKN